MMSNVLATMARTLLIIFLKHQHTRKAYRWNKSTKMLETFHSFVLHPHTI